MSQNLLGELGEPEVSNLGLALVHENVSDFEVSVDHVLLSEVEKTLEDVSDDGGRLVLVKVAVLPETRLEVSLVAELGDDVAVAVAGENLKALEHIGVTQFFEDVDFRE